MSDKMMQIPVDDLLASLKMGYEEYKDCLAKGNDPDDLAHVKGFCVTIEQILAVYGEVSKERMMQIKEPIIGNISLQRKRSKVNYDIPTVVRRQKK